MSDTKQVAKSAGNVLAFYQPEDLQPQPMFKAVTLRIPVAKSDFHEKPVNGQLLPKQHHLQRVADAAGVTFETMDTEKDDTSWTVKVRAFRRGPDGTMRHADGAYNYDWVDRAKEGGLKKFALQRAETGARLRALRAVLGLPTAFAPDNIGRVIEVCRIVVDTEAMLADPEMRQAALGLATGATEKLYGTKNVTPEPDQIEAPAIEADDDFPSADQSPEEPDPTELTEKQKKWNAIIDYVEAYTIFDRSPKAKAEIQPMIDGGIDDVDEELIESILGRVKTWCEEHPGARR